MWLWLVYQLDVHHGYMVRFQCLDVHALYPRESIFNYGIVHKNTRRHLNYMNSLRYDVTLISIDTHWPVYPGVLTFV